jgi:hypothetical protein
MSRNRIYDAQKFSSSEHIKIGPEGKRKNHKGVKLSPLTNNTPHIEHTDFDKKPRPLPKIEDNIETLLKEHGERRKKYEELKNIADINDDYFNGMNAHHAGIDLKDYENKLGISSDTRHKYLKGGKSRKSRKSGNKKSEKVGKNKNKNKKTLHMRKNRSTQRRK